VGHDKILVADPTQRAIPRFVVAASLVPGFGDGVEENARREAKVDTVVLEVAPPLLLIPFEAVHRHLRYTSVYTMSSLPSGWPLPEREDCRRAGEEGSRGAVR
jgi:hypothetical protein